VREDHGRRSGVEVLAHSIGRAACEGGVALALEVLVCCSVARISSPVRLSSLAAVSARCSAARAAAPRRTRRMPTLYSARSHVEASCTAARPKLCLSRKLQHAPSLLKAHAKACNHSHAAAIACRPRITAAPMSCGTPRPCS
jgi:hypothetical protein